MEADTHKKVRVSALILIFHEKLYVIGLKLFMRRSYGSTDARTISTFRLPQCKDEQIQQRCTQADTEKHQTKG